MRSAHFKGNLRDADYLINKDYLAWVKSTYSLIDNPSYNKKQLLNSLISSTKRVLTRYECDHDLTVSSYFGEGFLEYSCHKCHGLWKVRR